MTGWEITQRVDLFPTSHTQNAASQEKKRHVRAKASSQFRSRGQVQAIPGQAFQTQDCDRGIATRSSQPAADRYSFLETDLHPSREVPQPPPELARSIDEVPMAVGHLRIITFYEHLTSGPT